MITTADERSWRSDRSVLFLGEWCHLYEKRATWEQLDSKIIPYHWDDREQLYRDYLYVQELSECLLRELSDALNTFHGVRHSLRYWRILTGPWLGYFTQILFDRWTMIQRAARNYNITDTVVLDFPLEQVIPNDMHDFVGKFLNDPWNHHIYGRILSDWTSIRCERVPINTPSDMQRYSATLPLGRRLKRIGARVLSALSGALSRSSDAFFISTYLPLSLDFRLQLSFGQVPKLWRSPPSPVVFPNQKIRQQFSLAKAGTSGFEQCVRHLIAEQIPTLYLEGYQKLQATVDSLHWPKQPKLIFTSNNYNADEIFKAWAGAQIENGHPLVIGQHGGTLGASLWNFIEEHEQNIADRCLTWGWSDGETKRYPTCALKLQGTSLGLWNPCGGILLVTMVMPRYSYWMYSGMVAGQTISYLNDQFRFAASLPDDLKQKLLVRLYPSDWGWSQAERWKNCQPGIKLASTRSSFRSQMHQSRLVVATYNSTTFLETLGLNIPTIIFWNPKHWELRLSAQPYFDRIKKVGIFHESPESAAAKAAEVWNDVAKWWNQQDVQEARIFFCDHFARMPTNPLQVISTALTTLPNTTTNSTKI
ncbi:MAG: LIC12162 family protein [Gallionella sp.]|nr:LIC12162 family protein [Gallionella sp.]